MRRFPQIVLVLLLASPACGGGAGDSGSTTTAPTISSTTSASSTSTTATTTSSTTTTPSSTATTTEAPAPTCATEAVIAALDAALIDARLTPGGAWNDDVSASSFADQTANRELWPDVLGLDCGVRLVQPDAPGDRLALVAWTGPRMAFVIRASDSASPSLAKDSIITIGYEDPFGEFVREDNSLWAGVLQSGETLVVGHLDFNLGIVAKTFSADAPPFGDEEPTLDAERVAIAALQAVGARNVGIAQPPEFDSEEGYVQLVSPTGQILVADVAPLGWFDPMVPRYFQGTTEIHDVAGVMVRVTEPAEGEGLYSAGVEVGWVCGEHVWLLEPAANGTGIEQVAFAGDLIAAGDC